MVEVLTIPSPKLSAETTTSKPFPNLNKRILVDGEPINVYALMIMTLFLFMNLFIIKFKFKFKNIKKQIKSNNEFVKSINCSQYFIHISFYKVSVFLCSFGNIKNFESNLIFLD